MEITMTYFEWLADIFLGMVVRPLTVMLLAFCIQFFLKTKFKMLESLTMPHPRLGAIVLLYYIFSPTQDISSFFALGFFVYDLTPWIKEAVIFLTKSAVRKPTVNPLKPRKTQAQWKKKTP
jgi:hypothetical protein